MGPLAGVRLIEFAGIGPGPFAAMLLADMGAEVLRVDRPGDGPPNARQDVLNRGRRSLAVDLKHPEGVALCLDLAAEADGLMEGYRPGVMERLGLGPEAVLERNPRLVYGRMTGWGQHGPLASAAGHDINYIALSGALHAIGTAEAGPVPPLNLVGDFGGGALYLAFGMVCALLETQRSGRGQVVDAAMTDGAASLMAMTYALRAAGQWSDRRGVNLLDGGAHFYGTYECADGGWLAVGPIEPRFYRELLERIGLADDETLAPQLDARQWPAMRARLAEVFRQRPRDEWCRLLEGTDACVSPVLSLAEAPEHAHNRARETFVEHRGVVQPAPAPRFSRTPGAIAGPPPLPGQHTREALADWGIDAGRVDSLIDAGAVATLSPGG